MEGSAQVGEGAVKLQYCDVLIPIIVQLIPRLVLVETGGVDILTTAWIDLYLYGLINDGGMEIAANQDVGINPLTKRSSNFVTSILHAPTKKCCFRI